MNSYKKCSMKHQGENTSGSAVYALIVETYYSCMSGMIMRQMNSVRKKQGVGKHYSREKTGLVCYCNVITMSPLSAVLTASNVGLETTLLDDCNVTVGEDAIKEWMGICGPYDNGRVGPYAIERWIILLEFVSYND